MVEVPRLEMPQIVGEDLPNLLVYLGDLGFKFEAGVMNPNKMNTHQDVDWDKAAIIAQHPTLMRKPVIITKDQSIIDGNHRHAAHILAKSEKMGFIKIDMTFEEALVLLNSFPFCQNVPLQYEYQGLKR